MQICVIGSGYVGLVAGACFAEMGNDVICADIDEAKIASLQKGHIPLYEPGLEELVTRNQEEGRLSFTTSTEEGVKKSLLIFIAVGTPQREDGSADLTDVFKVVREIGQAMDGYRVIVVKSTVSIGAGQKIKEVLRAYTSHPFDVVSNPEFMKEGAAIEDFMRPDRVVIGTDSERAITLLKHLYEPFMRTGKPILFMDINSAELTKYVANAMLAARVSFMNEVANLCERLGANVNHVREGVGSDSRIGSSFLFPGIGYGGSCFPKDLKALLFSSREVGYPLKIITAVHEVNEAQKLILLPKIEAYFKDGLEGKAFAIWGLAFKPKTDDMREAPSIALIEALLRRKAIINAHDPAAMKTAEKIFGDKIRLFHKNYDTLKDADALIIVTEWYEFRRPNFSLMAQLMKRKVIFDGRNIYDPQELKSLGFDYFCLGIGDEGL